MKRATLFLLFLMALFFVSSAEAASPVHLGTIPYQRDKLLMINATHNVDLTFLYSPVSNGLRFNNLGFNSVTNQTAYSFFSNTLIFDYRFINDTKTFYLQELSTSQIYTFSIDYRNATIPENPWKTNHTLLLTQYNLTLASLALANQSLGNLSLFWNRTIAKLNLTLANATYNSSLYESRLVNMSLNLSLVQSSYNALYREKRALEDNLFATQIVFALLIPFCVILSLYLAKKFGFLNTNPEIDREKKRLDIGYGPLQDWHDKRIAKKNDEITRERETKKNSQQNQPIFEEIETIPVKQERKSTPSFSTFASEYDRIDQMLAEKDLTKKQTPIETKQKIGEPTMRYQVKIIKRMYEEGASASEIIQLTGFNEELINTICRGYEDRKQ